MGKLKSKTVILCLVVILAFSISSIDAEESNSEKSDTPQAEERVFKHLKKKKLAPIVHKKNWLASFFTRSPDPEPPTVHTLAPLQHYPIWKIHKYKGIELRPVQVVDVPTTYEYAPVQPELQVEQVRVPHTEYGPPSTTYGVPSNGPYDFNNQLLSSELYPPYAEEPVNVVAGPTVQQFDIPTVSQPTLQELHAQKLRTVLAALKSHKNIFKKLKSWKQSSTPAWTSYTIPNLPEVVDVPLGGFEQLNLQVPEIPAITLPSYASAVSAGPYVKVQYGTPLPIVNYGYATLPYTYYPPVQTPAPYYGAPPLYDSYGTPLPSDAYSSAPSEKVETYALPQQGTSELQTTLTDSALGISNEGTATNLNVAAQSQQDRILANVSNTTVPFEKEIQQTQAVN